MEITGIVVAVVAIVVIYWVMKNIATLIGFITIGYLAYYGYTTYPAWVDRVSIMVEQWLV